MTVLAVDPQLARVYLMRKHDRLLRTVALLVVRHSERTGARDEHQHAQRESYEQDDTNGSAAMLHRLPQPSVLTFRRFRPSQRNTLGKHRRQELGITKFCTSRESGKKPMVRNARTTWNFTSKGIDATEEISGENRRTDHK
jgi:hypothetical protein